MLKGLGCISSKPHFFYRILQIFYRKFYTLYLQGVILSHDQYDTKQQEKHLRTLIFQRKNRLAFLLSGSCGAPVGIRTLDLLIRSQTLYPAELRALVYSRLEYITTVKRESQAASKEPVPRPALIVWFCQDLLDCEALCHSIIRIHEPLSFSAEISSACYLRDNCVELAYLRSDRRNCSDESCVDE